MHSNSSSYCMQNPSTNKHGKCRIDGHKVVQFPLYSLGKCGVLYSISMQPKASNLYTGHWSGQAWVRAGLSVWGRHPLPQKPLDVPCHTATQNPPHSLYTVLGVDYLHSRQSDYDPVGYHHKLPAICMELSPPIFTS